MKQIAVGGGRHKREVSEDLLSDNSEVHGSTMSSTTSVQAEKPQGPSSSSSGKYVALLMGALAGIPIGSS